jgi:hypothetical protein
MLGCYDKVCNLQKPLFKHDIEEIVNLNRKLPRVVKRDRSNTTFNTVINFEGKSINSEKKVDLPKFNPLGSISKHFNKFDDVV